jgi:hypothetical protein
MDYEIFHDESQIEGYWHGILLIPVEQKTYLLSLLEEARKNSRFSYPLSLKNIDKKGPAYGCAYSWITTGIAALAYKIGKNPIYIYLGKRERINRTFSKLLTVVGAKLIIFTERDCHSLMINYPDYGSKVETTFRMGLKGGLHALGNEENPISIIKIHFDGHKHYSRHVDKGRIISRLKGLRDYCSISDDIELIDDRSSNPQNEDCQSKEDCQLLQLTDLLVGSFRTYLGKSTSILHEELTYPVVPILKRMQQGYARMKNSRWFNSIWIGGCYLTSNGWEFQNLVISLDEKFDQMELF